MYSPVATPFRTTPDTITTARTASERGGVTRARAASMTAPTKITLHSVPIPGRCRSGIHSSNTSAPAMIAQVPTGIPVRRDRPWCSTSHGSTPSPASSNMESLIPYRTRPANNWMRRRGMPLRCRDWLLASSAGSQFFWPYLTNGPW